MGLTPENMAWHEMASIFIAMPAHNDNKVQAMYVYFFAPVASCIEGVSGLQVKPSNFTFVIL